MHIVNTVVTNKYVNNKAGEQQGEMAASGTLDSRERFNNNKAETKFSATNK